MINIKKFRNTNLIIIFPFAISKIGKDYYGKTGFENQVMEFTKYFRAVKVYAVLSKLKKGTKLSKKDLVVKGMFYRNENLIDLLLHYFRYKSKIRKIIKSENSNSIFLTFIPGSFIGLIAANLLKKNRKRYFLRTVADLGLEFKRRNNSLIRKSTSIIVKPLLDILVKRVIKGAVNFNSGRILYKSLPKQHKIISSSFTKYFFVKTNKSFEEPYKLLYVGRLEGKKGIEFLIKSIAQLKEKYRFSLKIVGDGPDKNKVLKTIKKYRLNDKVNLVGFAKFGPDLFKFYKEADILIMPSLEEIQGKTHLEAMSFGTPVIASNIPGIRDIIINRKNGLLVKPRDSEQITKAVIELIKDSELRKRIIKNGYLTAKKNNIEYQTMKIIEILAGQDF